MPTGDALVGNAAAVKQVQRAGREERFKLADDDADLKEIMGTDVGRRFVHRLLGRCRVHESSFTGNSHTFFNEGMRNVGLMQLSDLNRVCPELYVLMLDEANRRAKRQADSNAATQADSVEEEES